MKGAIACLELCREIGNSAALRPYRKREVMPGHLYGAELENFIRDAATTYTHETCTAKMGRDSMARRRQSPQGLGYRPSFVLLTVPSCHAVTTGNTMAPCVVIGERAAEVLRAEYRAFKPLRRSLKPTVRLIVVEHVIPEGAAFYFGKWTDLKILD